MEWSKIKNIILILLLIVNGFLLVLVGVRQWRSAQYAQRARDEVVAIFQRENIRLDRSILPRDGEERSVTIQRDQGAEAEYAQALLGTLEPAVEGAAYQGEKGWVRFYQDGELTAQFQEGAYPAENPEGAAQALAEVLHMETEPVEVDWERGVVTLRQCYQGKSVFNCEVIVRFADGYLTGIEGGSRRIPGTVQTGGGEKAMTAPTALMRFLDYIQTHGNLCTEVTEITAGYRLETQTEPARLAAGWEIVTDVGRYYVDGSSGVVSME